MAAPFIYVGRNKLKAGKLEAYQQDFVPELVKVVHSNEPRLLLAFNVSVNDDECRTYTIRAPIRAPRTCGWVKTTTSGSHLDRALPDLVGSWYRISDSR